MLISAITADPSIQPRAGLNPSRVKQFVEILTGGGELAPVTIFFDGDVYWLADGFHRHESYRQARRTEVPAKVHQGTFRDAILCGIQSNAQHGLSLSLEERRNAAYRLLIDPEWQDWSSRKIGRICGLNHETVEKIKSQHLLQNVSGGNRQIQSFTIPSEQDSNSDNPEILQNVSGGNRQIQSFTNSSEHAPDIRLATRNGKEYTIDVSKNRRKRHSEAISQFPNVIDITHTTKTVFEALPASNDKELETFCIHSVQFDEPLISDNQYEFNFKLLTSGSAHALPCVINMMCDFPSFAQYVYRQARILATQSSRAL